MYFKDDIMISFIYIHLIKIKPDRHVFKYVTDRQTNRQI